MLSGGRFHNWALFVGYDTPTRLTVRIKLFCALIPLIYRDPVEISLFGVLKGTCRERKADLSKNRGAKRAFFVMHGRNEKVSTRNVLIQTEQKSPIRKGQSSKRIAWH